jgi:hypothetical protein
VKEKNTLRKPMFAIQIHYAHKHNDTLQQQANCGTFTALITDTSACAKTKHNQRVFSFPLIARQSCIRTARIKVIPKKQQRNPQSTTFSKHEKTRFKHTRIYTQIQRGKPKEHQGTLS